MCIQETQPTHTSHSPSRPLTPAPTLTLVPSAPSRSGLATSAAPHRCRTAPRPSAPSRRASSPRTSGSVTAEYARSPYQTPHLAGAFIAPGWSTLIGGSEHPGPPVFFHSTTPRLKRPRLTDRRHDLTDQKPLPVLAAVPSNLPREPSASLRRGLRAPEQGRSSDGAMGRLVRADVMSRFLTVDCTTSSV